MHCVPSTFSANNTLLIYLTIFPCILFLSTRYSKKVCNLRACFHNFPDQIFPWYTELQRKQIEIKMTKTNSKVENSALQILAKPPSCNLERCPLCIFLQ